jgi:acetyltransferase-like isoleucine patch superfamily enzyme
MLRLVWFSTIGLVVGCAPHPRMAAGLLRLAGARIADSVRVHRLRLMNHELGLANLEIGPGVYIGPECLIDVAGPVRIGARACLSARSILISHSDPNSSHGNANAARFPVSRRGVTIGADVWIGVGAMVLEGASVGDRSVIGAGSVVRGTLDVDGVYAGVPARSIKSANHPGHHAP